MSRLTAEAPRATTPPIPIHQVAPHRAAAATAEAALPLAKAREIFEAEIGNPLAANRWSALSPAERTLLKQYPPYAYYTNARGDQALRVYGASTSAAGEPELHIAVLRGTALVNIRLAPSRAPPRRVEAWPPALLRQIAAQPRAAEIFLPPQGWVSAE